MTTDTAGFLPKWLSHFPNAPRPAHAGCIALIVYFLTSFCARYYPELGEDEGQIVSLGNHLFSNDGYGFMNWDMAAMHPVNTLCYLSCGLAEMAWRATSDFGGPRLISTLGIPCVILAMFLLLRGLVHNHGWRCLGIAIACALDPFLVRHAQSGRMDALALSVVLFSAVAARRHIIKGGWLWLVFSGALLGCSFFFWIRALVAWPVVVVALMYGQPWNWRLHCRRIILLSLSTALSLGALWLAHPQEIVLHEVFIREAGGKSFIAAKIFACAASASALQLNPFLLVATLLSLPWLFVRLRTSSSTAGVTVAAAITAFGIGIITASQFHAAHYVYLVPFAGIVLACCLDQFMGRQDRRDDQRFTPLFTVFLASMVAWNVTSACLSKLLKVRPVPAHGYPSAEILLPHLPSGSHRVLSFDPRMYYALRLHGKSATSGLIGATVGSIAKLMEQEQFAAVITLDGGNAEGQADAVEWATRNNYEAIALPGYHLYRH